MLVIRQLEKLLYISIQRVFDVLDLQGLLLLLLKLAHRVHFELIHVDFELIVDHHVLVHKLLDIVHRLLHRLDGFILFSVR